MPCLEDQVSNWLEEGAACRSVGKTVFNERSSRSHAIATVHIRWEADARHEARVYLVDLAGSERAGQYALGAEQLKQGVNINKSLSTMARVITVMASGAAEHVPYRDSALTWLLSDAITGRNARAFMLATMHPAHAAETLSTLQYAQHYSSIKSNQEAINKLGSKYRKQLALVQTQRKRFNEARKELNLTRAAVEALDQRAPQHRDLIRELFDLQDLERELAKVRAERNAAKDKAKEKQSRMSREDDL